jgi:hypothetical protein
MLKKFRMEEFTMANLAGKWRKVNTTKCDALL